MLIRNWQNCTIENNYFDSNWSSPLHHGEQISPGNACENIILRNNIFKDSLAYVVGMHVDNNIRWQVYNNLIIGGSVTSAFGSADSGHLDVWQDSDFYNNTFIDIDMGGYGAFFVGNLTDPEVNISRAYNNLFYDCVNPTVNNSGYSGIINHGHSLHYLSTGSFDDSEGGTAQIALTDPLVEATNGNYHLIAHTNAGMNLGSPYYMDYDGVMRSNWDIGAYEYVSGEGDVTPPGAPSGLSVD